MILPLRSPDPPTTGSRRLPLLARGGGGGVRVRSLARKEGAANESNAFPLPPYFYAIFTPLSVRVSEDLGTAYQPLFGTLYVYSYFSREVENSPKIERVIVKTCIKTAIYPPGPKIDNVTVTTCIKTAITQA